MKTVHILNGDSIKGIFAEQGIEGDLIIWREALCEGPTTVEVGSEAFLQTRAAFFQSHFEVSQKGYLAKTQEEFDKLKGLGQYDEIILWFEYDLFCQINLLAACSYLHLHPSPNSKISLVCLGEHPSSEGLIALGEIDPSYYPELYENRTPLSQEDLAYGHQLWVAYNGHSHKELEKLIANPPATFPYIKAAIQEHFKRFPDQHTGLNKVEKSLLELADQEFTSTRKLVGQMLRNDRLYGAGDMSYFAYMDRLKGFLSSEEPTQLTEHAKAILTGKEKERLHTQSPLTFGGSRTDHFFWSEEEGTLTKVDA